MATSQRTMVPDSTNSTYVSTMQSHKSPRKHRSVPTLQDMMSADETLTGLPTRVPERRLRGRKERDFLAAIERNGVSQKLKEGQPTRRRRKSDFEIYRDGKVGDSPEDTAAVTNTSPVDFGNRSPASHSYQERKRREKEIEALEEEYVNDRRAKAASPVDEDTEDETTATGTVSNSNKRNQPSISTLLLSHKSPDPQFTPLPAPPLSLLHRKLSSLTTPSPAPQKVPAHKAPAIPPTPILHPPLPNQDISPLQHMRAFRAHFEALLPTPQPQPHRRSHPQNSSRQQPSSQKPRQNLPKTHSSSSTSSNSPASFVHQYAFTLSHLTPLTHHSKTAIVSLTPTNSRSSGFITLQLRNLAELKGGGKYTYIIPTHGLPVTVTDHESGSRNTYEIEDLPLKHLQAVRYAKHFVDVVKKGTIVGRVEVREKFGGGAVWLGRRWGDGRFEALKEGASEGGIVVEIKGDRGDKVRIFKNGKPIREPTARYEKVIDRAQRMWSACNRVLEEAEQTEDEEDEEIIASDSDETTTIRKRAEMVSPSRNSSSHDSAGSDTHAPDLDKTFRIDATTTFVPNVGWCRRASDSGWWSMLFLDGVRLEIDPTSGDAVWIERGGTSKVLKRGMEMKKVRERVKRFVDQGL